MTTRTLTNFSAIDWIHTNEGVFYSKYPDHTGKAEGTEVKRHEYHSLFYHKLGTPYTEDVLVAEFRDNPSFMWYAHFVDDISQQWEKKKGPQGRTKFQETSPFRNGTRSVTLPYNGTAFHGLHWSRLPRRLLLQGSSSMGPSERTNFQNHPSMGRLSRTGPPFHFRKPLSRRTTRRPLSGPPYPGDHIPLPAWESAFYKTIRRGDLLPW